MNITEYINQLPFRITVGDHQFDFQIIKNGQNDIRVGYDKIEYGFWYNPYIEKHCGFLALFEGISTDDDLKDALSKLTSFLYANLLIKDPDNFL